MMELLMDLGADVNKRGSDDMTPLHYAARYFRVQHSREVGVECKRLAPQVREEGERDRAEGAADAAQGVHCNSVSIGPAQGVHNLLGQRQPVSEHLKEELRRTRLRGQPPGKRQHHSGTIQLSSTAVPGIACDVLPVVPHRSRSQRQRQGQVQLVGASSRRH